MADPRGFMKSGRETPQRRPVEERVRDFRELYLPLGEEKLKTQGSRCMDCGVPFCQSPTGCPVENLIPDWNDLVHRGRWKDALKALHSTNNFPEFTGKLCPAPCESACVLGIHSDPVAIRNIESSIIDRGFEEGWVQPMLPVERTGKRVAVVGSGPAGLAAAQQLARAGHAVTVYEKAQRPGGLLRYGIPEFKMEKRVLDRRLAQLIAEGVEFRTGVSVGKDLSADELVRGHDAVCLAMGAEQPRDLDIPGRGLAGVMQAMDYLVRQNRSLEGDARALTPSVSAQGKRVVIIGGGDTGSDCLGTAHRQGCFSAMQFELMPEPPRERASSTPWPLWPMQLRTSHAHEEGGSRRWSVSTTEFIGECGKLTGVRTQQVAFEGGSFAPIPGTEQVIPADLVILAMGFAGPVRGGLLEDLGLRHDARGNVATGADYMTSRDGVFAAGDVRRGASLIVWAIAEGRKMAASVDRYLRREAMERARTE